MSGERPMARRVFQTEQELRQEERRLLGLRIEQDGRRVAYEAAKAELDRPDRAAVVAAAHAEVLDLVGQYTIGATGEAAIALLSRASYVVERLRRPEKIVRTYEAHQLIIDEMAARVHGVDETPLP